MQHLPRDTRHALLLLLLSVFCTCAAQAAEQAAGIVTEDPLDTYAGQLRNEQRTRVAPIVQAAGTNAPARQGALLEALKTLNPDLSQALDDLNADRPAEALAVLDRLAGSPDPFLATHVGWFRVRALVARERYEEALAALTAIQTNAEKYSLLAGDMLYTQGRLHACLLDRPVAVTILRRYLQQYPNAAAERRGAAQELLNKIEKATTNSLSEVAALMDDSRRRLQLADCGELTQARQQQIGLALGIVIEQVEKKPAKGGGTKSPGKGGKPGKADKPEKEGEPGGEGAKESALSEKDMKVSLEEPEAGGNPDDWARAYAREREAVQRELQTRVPEAYRDLIEQYYRSLSDEGKTEADRDK
jgi:hypothetical protein